MSLSVQLAQVTRKKTTFKVAVPPPPFFFFSVRLEEGKKNTVFSISLFLTVIHFPWKKVALDR